MLKLSDYDYGEIKIIPGDECVGNIENGNKLTVAHYDIYWDQEKQLFKMYGIIYPYIYIADKQTVEDMILYKSRDDYPAKGLDYDVPEGTVVS